MQDVIGIFMKRSKNMGIRKNNRHYKLLTPIDWIPTDIVKSTTRLKQSPFEYDKKITLIAYIRKPDGEIIIKNFPDKDSINAYIIRMNEEINSSKNNINASQKSESEQIQQYELIRIGKKIPVQNELVNSNNTISMTRLKKYNKYNICKMLCSILHNIFNETPKSDRIYLSHLQIYKHCKNVINAENATLVKVDDSTYVSISRLNLLTEIICYLFSLINHDTLNFDENGNFINDFVEKNIQQICEWEYKLRYSLVLDGFFQAIYDLIMHRNTDIFIDDELKFGDKITDNITNADKCNSRYDYKKILLDKLSLSASFFIKYSKKPCSGKTKNYIHELFKPTIFINRNFEQKYITNLENSYKEWFEDLSTRKKSYNFNTLEELFCFYHINRVTHIIDMKNMTNFTTASLPIHRLNGLFTPIILKQIFEENNILSDKKSSEFSSSKYNDLNQLIYCYSTNENRSHRNITERDIVFIKDIIDNISSTFKENIFATIKNGEAITDYIKAYKYFEDFSGDIVLRKFLNECDFINIINSLRNNTIETDYYRQIYDDLLNCSREEKEKKKKEE